AILELARFQAECCLRRLTLNGQQLTPDAVVRDFPNRPDGKLGIARFLAECCLKGLPLNGLPVTPEMVAGSYRALRATLELARFKEQCCLKGLALNGEPVTADAVVNSFPDSPEGKLGIARFREQCCLRGLALNGQPVKTDAVAMGFPDSPEGKLGLSRFMAECCLRGLRLKGRPVTTDAVVKGFQSARATLEMVRFKEQCCLKGLALNGQPVTPDMVVEGYQSVRAPLELARFKADCCLMGLELNGQLVAPAEVINDFPDTLEGKLGIARFKAECCLRGMLVNGRQVTPDAVAQGYLAARAALELARFKEQCCLKGLRLNGQKVTPLAVVNDFPDSPDGKLGRARFTEQCCLNGLALNHQQVTPDAVVRSFPDSPEGRLGIARFKEQCCLKGLLLNDQQVTPEDVVRDYERGGWLLERAIFYAQLALNARELNGRYLDNQKVLAAFNELPGDHSSRQARYLIQRLKQPQHYDETDEAREILQTAWQILNNVSTRDDEQHRLQCLLKFTAMYHELPINGQKVPAEQVLQSINLLRSSFQNLRMLFFFLSHCHITRQSVNGRHIHKDQVMECLQLFPEGTKLRHALAFWFEQCSCEASIIENILYNLQSALPSRWDSDCAQGYAASRQPASGTGAVTASVAEALRPLSEPLSEKAAKQAAKTAGSGFSDSPVPRLNALTLKTLGIIQKINGSYADPAILITGSCARFLQNRCSLFIDIDIKCTTEASARRLMERLQALNVGSGSDEDIPQSIIIWAIPGYERPKAYNVHLNYGDLCTKAVGLSVTVDPGLTDENTLAVKAPDVELDSGLSFAEETGLLNNTLGYLVDNLDLLTAQLQKGAVFDLPQTLLFNTPKNPEERIYGLLTCALVTLNNARRFIALNSEGKPEKTDCPPDLLQKDCQHLLVLTENLQAQLNTHPYRVQFELRVNEWLSTIQNVSDDEIERKDLIKVLLAMMHPE
ncbi:hypothetical protein, partial [Endozoicomonas sp. SESOKO1]|uniref:hypothetical protein n=1 Tax=Endozoicomonas sp. SESOKO1 TaxID=2828742 RepID=UPI0021493F09